MKIDIEESWKEVLKPEFARDYFEDLTSFVKEEYVTKTIYPRPQDLFTAFEKTPFDNASVVILGQDPYHGKDQAHGLSFSVQEGVRIPPSLRNIYKEIESDLGITVNSDSGDLTRWAQQGVLLLNATLTVEAGKPGSHQGKGWEQFTDSIIQRLSDDQENIVFILWGNYARTKGARIERTKHLVIETPHPSPFSAYNGFFGSKPFSQTNDYLRKHNKPEIDWR